MKILSIIVTFNRLSLLKNCINAINNQTRKVNELIVIDNGSDDGTENFLKQNNINTIRQKNLGSAGGWHTAINFFLNNKFDAIWMMDDDGYPDINALYLLEQKLTKSYACVSSVVLNQNNTKKFIFPFPKLNNKGLPIIFSIKRKIPYLADLINYCNSNEYNFIHLFNGALISHHAIKSIGNVNKNYFIYGDEVDYYFRLKKYGEVVSVLDSYHYHPDVSQRPLSRIKLYYFIKNTIILNQLYFDHIHLRNMLTIVVGIFRFFKTNKFKIPLKILIYYFPKLLLLSIIRGYQKKIKCDYNA